MAALREIRYYQKFSDQASIAWAPFGRLVREIAQNVATELKIDDVRFQAPAIEALRTACEDMVTSQFLGKCTYVRDM